MPVRFIIIFAIVALLGIIVAVAQNQGKKVKNTSNAPVHTNFDLAFTDGHKFTGDEDAIVPVSVIKVGDLKLSSGKIMACDPGILSPGDAEQYTFERSVPNGQHPVFICMATVGPKHDRVAAVKVQFSDEKVVKWEMALKPGQRMQDLKPNERFGYGVDCGTGCFADPATFSGLKDSDYDESTTDKLWHDMDEHGGEYGSLTFPKGNLIAVHSGWGDGFYPSYFGLDAGGKPACLATDFEVLLTSIDGAVTLHDLPSQLGKKVDSHDLKEINTDVAVRPVAGKPNAVLLDVTGDGASSLDIDHKKSKGISQSTVQYTDNGKTIEIDFAVSLSEAELTLNFSKGTRAFK